MQSDGPVRQPYLLYRSARLHRLAVSIPELLNILRIRAQVFVLYISGGGWFMQTHYWTVVNCRTVIPEVGVLVRKLSRLTPLSYAKRGLTPGISYCSVDSAVNQPAVYTGLSWTPSPRQPAEAKPNLSQLCLAKPAKLNFFKTPASASIAVAETHNTHIQGQIMISLWLFLCPLVFAYLCNGVSGKTTSTVVPPYTLLTRWESSS